MLALQVISVELAGCAAPEGIKPLDNVTLILILAGAILGALILLLACCCVSIIMSYNVLYNKHFRKLTKLKNSKIKDGRQNGALSVLLAKLISILCTNCIPSGSIKFLYNRFESSSGSNEPSIRGKDRVKESSSYRELISMKME